MPESEWQRMIIADTLVRMGLRFQCQTATLWSWRRSCWKVSE